MFKQQYRLHYRSILALFLVAVFLVSVIAPTADARRPRNAITGAALGAGAGALVDGGSGARTGAVAGAIVGAIR